MKTKILLIISFALTLIFFTACEVTDPREDLKLILDVDYSEPMMDDQEVNVNADTVMLIENATITKGNYGALKPNMNSIAAETNYLEISTKAENRILLLMAKMITGRESSSWDKLYNVTLKNNSSDAVKITFVSSAASGLTDPLNSDQGFTLFSINIMGGASGTISEFTPSRGITTLNMIHYRRYILLNEGRYSLYIVAESEGEVDVSFNNLIQIVPSNYGTNKTITYSDVIDYELNDLKNVSFKGTIKNLKDDDEIIINTILYNSNNPSGAELGTLTIPSNSTVNLQEEELLQNRDVLVSAFQQLFDNQTEEFRVEAIFSNTKGANLNFEIKDFAILTKMIVSREP